MNIKKMTLTAMFVALGVVCSSFFVPVGVAKLFPVQHAINVLAAVFLVPVYAVTAAFLTSLLRVLMGMGSLLAFPGSMCGALLAGLLYRRFRRTEFAMVGEIIGTGLIGALLAFPVATFFMGREVAALTFVVPFALSCTAGAIIGAIVAATTQKVRGEVHE